MEDESWKQKLETLLAEYGETLADVVHSVPPLDSPEMTTPFDDSYGGTNGCAFTVWTAKRVYFPICYDGSEWVGSAPRDPRDEACGHQGGG